MKEESPRKEKTAMRGKIRAIPKHVVVVVLGGGVKKAKTKRMRVKKDLPMKEDCGATIWIMNNSLQYINRRGIGIPNTYWR